MSIPTIKFLTSRAVPSDGYEDPRTPTQLRRVVADGNILAKFECEPKTVPGILYRVTLDTPGQIVKVFKNSDYQCYLEFDVYPVVAYYRPEERVITVYASCAMKMACTEPGMEAVLCKNGEAISLYDAQLNGTLDQRRADDGKEIRWDINAVFRCKGLVGLFT